MWIGITAAGYFGETVRLGISSQECAHALCGLPLAPQAGDLSIRSTGSVDWIYEDQLPVPFSQGVEW